MATLKATKNDIDGYIAELALAKALQFLQVKHQTNPVEDFKVWLEQKGDGCDAKIYSVHKLLVEVKNYSGKYWITPSMFRKSMVERFHKLDPEHKYKWILIISQVKFTSTTWSLVKDNKIFIITLGFKITPATLKKAIKLLILKLAIILKVRKGLFKYLRFGGFVGGGCGVSYVLPGNYWHVDLVEAAELIYAKEAEDAVVEALVVLWNAAMSGIEIYPYYVTDRPRKEKEPPAYLFS